jgi:putative transposase
VHTTDSKHALPVAPNVLTRQFDPAAQNLAYASDITYIRTGAGWLYLAVVLDLFSRKVVGWAMAPSMPAALVCDALRMAIQVRRPAAGLILHSDRGSQYASDQYQALLAGHGFVCGMSRKGNCWDNAVVERFFLNLKMERVWQSNYANHAEARLDVANYIAGFYKCWAICRPASTSAQWQRKNLSSCPKLLDHYSLCVNHVIRKADESSLKSSSMPNFFNMSGRT